MPVKKLTIQLAQADVTVHGKDVLYRDTEISGFCMRVTSTNARIFLYQYRTGGRGTPQRKIKIGRYPAIKPDEARKIAIQYASELARKEDPQKRLKAAAEARQHEIENSFEIIFNKYAEKRLTQNRSGEEVKRAFARDFMPKLRNTAIADVTRADISKIIDSIVERDAPYAANRALSFIKTFFRWALGQGYVRGDPTSGMQRPFKGETSRDRVLTPEEIKLLWAEFTNLGYPFEQVLRTLMLTGQRREEVGSMQWGAVNYSTGMWSIGREVTKNKQPHQVPLTPLCLKTIWPHPDDHNEQRPTAGFVFTTTGETPVSGWSKAKRRILESLEKQGIEMPDWRFHDFRRTMSSTLGDMGYRDQDIAMLLNHQSRGVTAVYNRSQYISLKQEMLLKWNNRLMEIIGK